ncbi:MAG TPA: acetyl-CoA synthetase [Lentisphaeria bacterium]|nr:MAG: hypothetical protein A2X47_12010 [Lentisphaerae bacterium GWF2_38_69]HBM16703.1 acetyl-CoA synthetase [Lentisphaeria bacterium]
MIVNNNIGYLCTRRQCELGLGENISFRWLSSKNHIKDFSFSDLDKLSNRFANALLSLEIQPGEVVFTFLPKCPEQFFVFLGTLKNKCIIGTLFTSFGNEALLDRLGDSKATAVITTKAHYHKLKSIIPNLPHLKFIIIIDSDTDLSDNVLSYSKLILDASEEYQVRYTPPETPSVLHYTSGSTGKPKGVLHCHRSILHQSYTTANILGLEEEDIYWCTADQGWVTGTSYGIIGPWSLGVTQIHYGGAYNPEEWMKLLETQKVNVWYTAPTALRMLMREDDTLYTQRNLSQLRSIFSVGEPLNPEILTWSRKVFKKDVYDTWFQTETGGIMISNCPKLEIKPGSMGKPVEGIEVGILNDKHEQLPVNQKGNLCLKPGWTSMFTTYLNNEEAYKSKFKNNWYHTGDMAYRDKDEYIWFLGRSDDVINTSGHLISPFEIESCLLEIPEILESGVIGVPDPLLYEKVVAFVHLKEGIRLDTHMELKLKVHLSKNLSTTAIPQEIIAIDSVPKNKSGKIMRRYLKATYLGQEAGDISTLDIN